MPSFLSTKRSRVVAAAAGTLTAAAAISAVAVTLPSGTAAVPAGMADAFIAAPAVHQAAQQGDMKNQAQSSYYQVRVATSVKQLSYQVTAERAAAAQSAAAKAAAARAAAVKAAAAKAAAIKAQQQAAAQQQAQTAAAQQPSGSPQQIAEQMLSQFGWSSSQFSCLEPLWQQESGWSVTATNPSSGAYGIPQAMPGSQMASAGSDWQTDAATQIRWGLQYIQSRYGSPCGAWAHEEADGWY